MPPRDPKKKLLVEGRDDVRVIPQLMEANGVLWGESSEEAVVCISPTDGFSNMVKEGLIETELKASGLKILGILADADTDATNHWTRLRNRCLPSFPELPDELPEDGLIVKASEAGVRLGIWLMPDNRSTGMMETFLTYLVPDGGDAVLDHAKRSQDEAKVLGAPFTETHQDKALIHTWLAWQDPPGRQLHDAITQKILDPTSPKSDKFVQWFRRLFDV